MTQDLGLSVEDKPNVVPSVYEFLSTVENKRKNFEECLQFLFSIH